MSPAKHTSAASTPAHESSTHGDDHGDDDRGDRDDHQSGGIVAASPAAAARWAGIDHVQVAIPVGGEPLARRFYAGRLGLAEVSKPAALADRGGAWFEAGDTRVHVGADPDFVAARKAHPALLVHGVRELVAAAELEVRWSDEIPGTIRCHLDDPFGNRIELIEAEPS